MPTKRVQQIHDLILSKLPARYRKLCGRGGEKHHATLANASLIAANERKVREAFKAAQKVARSR